MNFLESNAPLHDKRKKNRLQLRYCDQHDFPLPDQHKFPLEKYRLLREYLQQSEWFDLEPGTLASADAVREVHEASYVDGFLNGSLDPAVMRRVGFPWSRELVTRTLASAGSTILAMETALARGFGGTLAGGTHHAFRDRGAGFCVFNDLAIAITWARKQFGIRRAAIVDLDVHQGDGTAAIFEHDRDVFTLSLHGARNFPFRKQESSLDIELADETGDDGYLEKLEPALERIWGFEPELILYQSGVDGLRSDTLGRLALSLSGLRRRDRLVMEGARQRAIPLAVTIGGGYSHPIERTVEAHAQTFLTAAEVYLGTDAGIQPISLPDP